MSISDPCIVSSPTVEKLESTLAESTEFESLDHLVKALRSAKPDFDAKALSIRKDAPETYIAFAEQMELNDSQLSLLGVKDGSRL